MSIVPFLQGLIADGTIPVGMRYAISADNGTRGSGDVMTIANSDFTTHCIQVNLVEMEPVEGATLRLTNLWRKFVFTYTGGKWIITRNWTRPPLEAMHPPQDS